MDVTLEGDPTDTVTLSRELAEFLFAWASQAIDDRNRPAHLMDTLYRARGALSGRLANGGN